MFQDKIVHKIPGEIIQNKKESQGYLGKLEEKEDFELLELLERQEKLIANKYVQKIRLTLTIGFEDTVDHFADWR